MRSVSLAAAKVGLSALLDAVEAGEEVRITRRGKTIARLVPDHSVSEAEPQAWTERLKRFQQDQQALSSSGVALVRGLREEN